jgi:predicted dinucleotide-binding enzyme
VDVTIIGAGNMARGIGTRIRRSAAVQILDRDPDKARALAQDLGAESGQLGQTPIRGEIVVLAVPYPAVAEIADRHREEMRGRIVVDITNPVDFASFDRLVTPPGSSAAEEIEKLLPDVRIVKAFNTTFAGTLAGGTVGGLPTTVLIAGDDADAKQELIGLVSAGGLRAIDAGGLKRARELEGVGLLQITLAAAEKVSWTGGFAIVP